MKSQLHEIELAYKVIESYHHPKVIIAIRERPGEILTLGIYVHTTHFLIIQIKLNSRLLLLTYIILTGFLFTILMIGRYYNIPIESFIRNPTAVLGGAVYIGFISNIGILFWAFTTAICLFSSMIHKQDKNQASTRQFLFYSGLLTLWLLLDDMFMLHDSIFPYHLMIPEELIYLSYITVVLVYLAKFKTEILAYEYVILSLAFCFFALSVLIDLFIEQQGFVSLIEDGFKLFGITTWFIFFFKTCRVYLQRTKV